VLAVDRAVRDQRPGFSETLEYSRLRAD